MNDSEAALFAEIRKDFHTSLRGNALAVQAGIPTNADKGSPPSVLIAQHFCESLDVPEGERQAGQTAGRLLEEATLEFLRRAFFKLQHLRPGTWRVGRSNGSIAQYQQYRHLGDLASLTKALREENSELAAAIGGDYLITPDVVVVRFPEEDSIINAGNELVDRSVALATPLRKCNCDEPILHASVSCKWTIRSDRAQNARSEALNLVKNRKGKLPHVVVVTCEPLPSRLASVALGTGEIDCVYHVALPELQQAVNGTSYHDAQEMLNTLVQGRRLRDISDLPLDLVT